MFIRGFNVCQISNAKIQDLTVVRDGDVTFSNFINFFFSFFRNLLLFLAVGSSKNAKTMHKCTNAQKHKCTKEHR